MAHWRMTLVLGCLFAGCAHRTPLMTGVDETTPAPESNQVQYSPNLDEEDLVSAIPPEEEVRAHIAEARDAMKDSQFGAANRHLRQAFEALRRLESAESSQVTTESFHSEIAAVYGRSMPMEYLDSIPDDISVQIFRDLLFQYVDSLYVSAQDSMAMAKLLSQSSTTYDYPMLWNERVFKALVFFSKGRKGPVGRWLTRSTAYLPFIQKLFADSGLPVDLSYLPLIESGFNPLAYSHAHASGMWQFIPSTGKLYGLRRSFWLDERRDPVKSTIAAIRYLRRLHAEFGNWHLALASYNCGEGNMRRAIARANTSDFWQLKLHKETMSYIPQFIAALIVAKNRTLFGFAPDSTPLFDPDTVLVSDCIDMATIAEGIEVDHDQFKTMNPHILHWCTPPDVESVTLYLPQGTKERFHEFYSQLPEEKKVKWYRYRVRRGDNLAGVSRRFGVPMDALKSANRLRSNRLVAGRYLLVPFSARGGSPASPDLTSAALAEVREAGAAASSIESTKESERKSIRYRVKPGDTIYGLAKLFGVGERDILRWNGLTRARDLRAGAIVKLYPTSRISSDSNDEVSSAAPAGSPSTYEVKKGDNLTSIAREVGVTVSDLLKSNQRNESDPLYPGDRLILPLRGREQRQPPPPNSEPAQEPVSSPASADTILYKVAPGDNVSGLARLFGVEVRELLAINELTGSSVLRPGDVLRILNRASAPSDASVSPSLSTSGPVILYRVQAGDNLWRVAQLFNVSLSRLYQLNGLTKDTILMPGDTLRIMRSERL